jgi:hypothetical protein
MLGAIQDRLQAPLQGLSSQLGTHDPTETTLRGRRRKALPQVMVPDKPRSYGPARGPRIATQQPRCEDATANRLIDHAMSQCNYHNRRATHPTGHLCMMVCISHRQCNFRLRPRRPRLHLCSNLPTLAWPGTAVGSNTVGISWIATAQFKFLLPLDVGLPINANRNAVGQLPIRI